MTLDPHAWSGTCHLTENGRPVIRVGSETVPEAKRLQAAINMRLVPQVKAAVVVRIGLAEAKRRYPEGFCSDEELERMHPELFTEADSAHEAE